MTAPERRAPRVEHARLLVEALTAAGITATIDPAEVVGRAPCVLITPPRVAFDVTDASSCSWRLLVVAGVADELHAWQQLDQLLDQLDRVLPIETADPSRFAAGAGDPPLPAYAATYTDTVQ